MSRSIIFNISILLNSRKRATHVSSTSDSLLWQWNSAIDRMVNSRSAHSRLDLTTRRRHWLQKFLLPLTGTSRQRVVLWFWQSVRDQTQVSGAPDGRQHYVLRLVYIVHFLKFFCQVVFDTWHREDFFDGRAVGGGNL